MAASFIKVLRSCKSLRASCPFQKSFLGLTGTGSSQLISGRHLQRLKSTHSVQTLLSCQIADENISIKGWVKAVRWHKKLQFLHICDGSGPNHLQVVIPDTVHFDADLTFGSCVCVDGKLVESLARGQKVELLAEQIKVVGPCDTHEFPIKQRTRHSPQYMRDFLHLRPKTNIFGSLLRIRNSASMALHSFFQQKEYLFIHTPILTSSDCEGACEVFKVTPLREDMPAVDQWGSDAEDDWDEISTGPSQENELPGGQDGKPSLYFREPAYLTVSGQLHLEVMTGAMTKVYSFGPTFRAEDSVGSFHLSEFYMAEAELAFIEKLDDIMDVMEDLVKHIYQHVMDTCPEDVAKFSQFVAPSHFKENVEQMMSRDFLRLSYTDAVRLLEESEQDFKYKVEWGCDFKKEHELFITRALGNVPVFVTDFPSDIKPFYARRNSDKKTVSAVDMLVPGVGELCGGSLREERLDVLEDIMAVQGLVEQLPWYLDLRRFGSCSHGGFGLGFERLLVAMLGAHSVKDVIPFPRSRGRCKT